MLVQLYWVICSALTWGGGGGGGVLPYMGYIAMCGPKGYGFSAVLVINRVSILAILVINWVWFLHSSLDIGMF